MSSGNDNEERRFVAPFPGLAFTVAEKAGVGARSALLWKTTRYGIAGTGRRIVQLSGAAQTRAALAAIGKGPLDSGGRGMAGGLKTLCRIETTVALTLAGAYIGAVALANSDVFKAKPSPAADGCDSCGGPGPAEGGDIPGESATCSGCAGN